MKAESLLKYGLYLFLIMIGIVIGIAIRHYHNVPMVETINIIDIAALITTIFLAVYIPEVLDRKLKIKRDKKKLIDRRIDELQYLYGKINRLVQQNTRYDGTSPEVLNMLDICQSRIRTIAMLLDYVDKDISLEEDMKKVIALSKEHQQLFVAMQSAPDDEKTSAFLKNEERLYNEIDRATSIIVLKLSDA